MAQLTFGSITPHNVSEDVTTTLTFTSFKSKTNVSSTAKVVFLLTSISPDFLCYVKTVAGFELYTNLINIGKIPCFFGSATNSGNYISFTELRMTPPLNQFGTFKLGFKAYDTVDGYLNSTDFVSSNTNGLEVFMDINVASVNDRPIINSISAIPCNDPRNFDISYETLISHLDISDDVGDLHIINFYAKINGTVKKNGVVAVDNGTTTISVGESFVWDYDITTSQLVQAFSIFIKDGLLNSLVKSVYINVEFLAPSLTYMNTIENIQSEKCYLTYDLLKNNSDISDDKITPLFRFKTLINGTLLKGTTFAAPDTTINENEYFTWIAPSTEDGLYPAFSVVAYDTILESGTPITINIDKKSCSTDVLISDVSSIHLTSVDIIDYVSIYNESIENGDVRCFKCGSALSVLDNKLECLNSHIYSFSEYILQHSSFLQSLILEIENKNVCDT